MTNSNNSLVFKYDEPLLEILDLIRLDRFANVIRIPLVLMTDQKEAFTNRMAVYAEPNGTKHVVHVKPCLVI